MQHNQHQTPFTLSIQIIRLGLWHGKAGLKDLINTNGRMAIQQGIQVCDMTVLVNMVTG